MSTRKMARVILVGPSAETAGDLLLDEGCPSTSGKGLILGYLFDGRTVSIVACSDDVAEKRARSVFDCLFLVRAGECVAASR